MAIQNINLGASPDGRGGDTYREAHTKINSNFAEVEAKLASASGGKYGYLTYDAMVLDKASITANSIIEVTNDPVTAKNGLYNYDGIDFTRSSYDVLAASKAYTDKVSDEIVDKESKNKINPELIVSGRRLSGSGKIAVVAGAKYTGHIPVKGNTDYVFSWSNQVGVNVLLA